MGKTCGYCGIPMPGRRRDALYCSSTCKTKAFNAKKQGIEIVPPKVVQLPERGESTPLVAATRAELEAAGITGSDALLLLALAERIDTRVESSQALAALSKEYAARKAEMFSHAPAAADPFDELRALRERRRAQ